MWPLNSGKEELEQKIEELAEELEEAQEEREKWEKKFKAEEERRSKLSRRKQEAEEKINKLEDRIRGLKSQKVEENEEEEGPESRKLEFEEGKRIIRKLESLESSSEELVTLYHTGDRDDVEDLSGLKNSIDSEQNSFMSGNGVYFFDSDGLFDLKLGCRPFYRAEWFSGKEFVTSTLKSFIEQEKVWVKVSAGESKILREENGDIEVLEVVKDRVNRQHSSGGFSQGRFERKRDKQIEEHVKRVEEAIPKEENVFLVGERDLCSKLPGEFLGGFDPNQNDVDAVYGFKLSRL